MKKSLFLLVLCIATSITYSQSDSVLRKNSIRFNILPPLLTSTIEFSYERMINENMSIVAGFGTNFTGSKSDFVLNSDVDLSFLNRNIQNRYLLAEVRRYINFCECGPPNGFYAGGFARYNTIDASSDLIFGYEDTNVETSIETEFQSINFGVLLGYQVSYKNWLVDFEFAGVGYAPNWVEFNSSTALSSDELALLSEAISENFGFAGNYSDIELNSSNAKFKFWSWTIRYAVSIGYRF